MKRIRRVLLLIITALALFTGCKSEEVKQPNIVLLFVDDLGWADLGYRNQLFNTPNVNSLKEAGMNFDRAYVATPTCSPSRASILTGKEPVRMGMSRHITHEDKKTGRNSKEYNYWPKDPVDRPSRNWIPLEEVTYAEKLKEYGYYNKFVGKWHSGHEEYHPICQGFDSQYGTGNQGHPFNYYAPFFKHSNPLPQFTDREYLTDVLTDEAEKFIREYDKDKPFMLSLWYYTVHGPHIGKKELVQKYLDAGLEESYANYAAMVETMDISVGRVRKALKERGLDDNTVVIFTSDQGGAFQNGSLRGGKKGGFTLCEGGARVPLSIYYPGVTEAGSSSNTPVQTLDLFPTLCEIASGKSFSSSKIQGKSLMTLLNGGDLEERSLYFFRSYEDQYAAVIRGDWKLIKYHSGLFELYNLKSDISESDNLVDKNREIFLKMKTDLESWEVEAVPAY